MKRDKISLRWKLFGYIFIFATAIVLLFAFFQIFMLDDFYRLIKTRDINNLTSEVSNELDSALEDYNGSVESIFTSDPKLVKQLVTLSNDKEGSIYVFEEVVSGTSYSLLYSSSHGASFEKFMNSDSTLNDSVMTEIWRKASLENSKKNFYIIFTENTDTKFQIMVTPDSKAQVEDSLICGHFITYQGQRYMVVIDSRLTPVGPAVDTMKTQILYISLIIVILTIVVALLLARGISKPIMVINQTVKKMGKGDYNVIFKGHGYKEITELNNTLNNTITELKKTETLQRELIANVSHDLRTPLTLIAGYAEMMRDLPDEKTEENAQIIIDEANRLSLLVNDLLNLSRIKARTEPLNIISFNISELLQEIVTRQNKLLESSNMRINLLIDDEAYVNADRVKIEQVVYNFINNAINYSGESKVVEVILETTDTLVTVKVKDYGIGITTENLESIWQRYYRVDKGLQRSTQGSGLGLSIIKEILEYHGFSYGVESTPGKGSVFYFTMPRYQS